MAWSTEDNIVGLAEQHLEDIDCDIGMAITGLVDNLVVKHLGEIAESSEPEKLAQTATELLILAAKSFHNNFLDFEAIADAIFDRFQDVVDCNTDALDNIGTGAGEKLKDLEVEHTDGAWRVVVKECAEV